MTTALSGTAPSTQSRLVDDKAEEQHRERYSPFPLTDLQQAYWVGEHSGFELGKVAAHRYVEYEIPDCDIARLEHAWQRVVRQHDMLRAVVLPGGQQQILVSVPDYRIEVDDLRGKTPDAVASQLEFTRARMSNEGAPSHRWPLFELRASRLEHGVARIHISTNLIIHDGLSLKLMLDDFHRLYTEPDAILAPFEFSFRDYRLALDSASDSERSARDREYWHNRIATLPPAPELPLAISPSALHAVRFQRWTARLEAAAWQRFRDRAFKAGLTPSSVLCAAYAEVLAVWSKNPKFTLNFLSGNRARLHSDVKRIVGPFSTTVLLEVDNSIPGTVETRAQRLQERLAADLSHSSVSGVQVIREAARTQGWGSRALMPIVFANVIFSEMGDKEVSPISWRKVYHAVQTPQVYVDHQVRVEEGELVLNWDCVPSLFPEGLLDDMFGAYTGLVRRLATDEAAWQETDIGRMLVPRAHLELQEAANATEDRISDALLHTLFTAQAVQQPERPAVISMKQTLTYGDLDRQSSQVARWLRRAGVRPNQLVAVAMEKGWEQVVAVLGVLKSGGAYMPVDPSYPKDRIAYLLRAGHDSDESCIVLTQPWLDDDARWPEGVRRLCIGGTELAAEDDAPLDTVQGPGDLAYVIYTSGSTGQPKGIMIDHQGAVNTIIDLNRRFAIGPDDRTLALSSLSFDLSVYDIFGMLAAGGAVVMPDSGELRNPDHWAQLVTRKRVTLWNSVPALMAMFVESRAVQGGVRPDSLRLVWMSGDWIPVTLPVQIQSLLPAAQIVSLGGATEASIWSIAYPITWVDPSWKSIPYGRPLGNQRFYVLNQRLDPCPVWAPGELYIGGLGLAKGYRNDAEKTRAAFFKHPKTGERLYRTGDWGRFLPDGNIEFLGREDTQVKVRGFRIELGEIESALRQHPAVREAVVVTRTAGRRNSGDPGGDDNRSMAGSPGAEKTLVAYTLPNPQMVVSVDEIRTFVRNRLPEYMVPTSFVMLDTLPLSANGKVDRHRLPDPDSVAGPERVFVEPRDDLERQLAQIWREILGVRAVGVSDNFFDLGGHSLLGLRMLARIEDLHGKHLPLSCLFEGGTIEHLAAQVRQSAPAQPSSVLVAIQAKGRRAPFFCVHPSGGNVLCYSELSRLLGPEQPFYGLQSDFAQEELVPLETMAADYVSALLAVQPGGPYYLGGWSFGGLVAFEMAQQLHAQGKEVASLVLIDSWIPALRGSRADDELELLAAFVRDLGGWQVDGLRISREELGRLQPDEQLRVCLERLQAAKVVPTEFTTQRVWPLFNTFKRNVRAGARYVPCPYPGRITLLRTQGQAFEDFPDPARHPDYGWGSLTEEPVDVYPFRGNHYTLLNEPCVSDIAAVLRRTLHASFDGKPRRKISENVD
jgi:pyochelin synthetase